MANDHQARILGTVLPARMTSPIGVSMPGVVAVPVWRGRPLYTPLYARKFSVTPTGLGAAFGLTGGSSSIGGLVVSSSVVSGAASFLSTLGSIVSTVVDVITSIVSFITDIVSTIVSSIVGAVGGLVGAALDALNLKKDGDLDVERAAKLGGMLYAKYQSLDGSDKKGERPLTAAEKRAYDRNMNKSKSTIAKLTSGSAPLILGGAAALAAAIVFLK